MNTSLSNGSAIGMLTNNSSVTDAPAWLKYKDWLTFWFWLMIFLSALGTLLNVTLMLIIFMSKKLRTGCGALIGHLLFINTQLCLFHMPILSISTYYFAPYQQLGATFCNYTIFFYYSALYAVDWSSMLIGVNRFVAILIPHSYGRLGSKFGITTMIVAGWIVAFSCNLFLFNGVGGQFISTKPWGACGIKPFPSARVYPINTIICVTFPLSAEGVLYLTIFISVKIKSLMHRREVNADAITDPVALAAIAKKQAIFQRRYRSAKMLFVSFIWYSFCFLPAPIASSLFPTQYASVPLVQIFTRVLLLCGYTTIPVRNVLVLLQQRGPL